MIIEGDCFCLRGFQIYDTSLNVNQWMDKGVNINFVFAKLYHFEEIKDITIYSSVSGSFCVFSVR